MIKFKIWLKWPSQWADWTLGANENFFGILRTNYIFDVHVRPLILKNKMKRRAEHIRNDVQIWSLYNRIMERFWRDFGNKLYITAFMYFRGGGIEIQQGRGCKGSPRMGSGGAEAPDDWEPFEHLFKNQWKIYNF